MTNVFMNLNQDKVLTPREIVDQLDRYVVGQKEAKKKVAIALRHRAIRKFVQGDIRHEITPKNILDRTNWSRQDRNSSAIS